MKRRRETAAEIADVSRKKKCVTRWAAKNEQRSGGIVTVEEASSSSTTAFKQRNSTPLTDPPPPVPRPQPTSSGSSSPSPVIGAETSDFLGECRTITYQALVDSSAVPKLLECVTRKFIYTPVSESWGEECEAVLSILYVALQYPKTLGTQFCEEITAEFLERWVFDVGAKNIHAIDSLFTEKNKWANFSLLLLLIGNHLPEKVEAFHLEECLRWSDDWYIGCRPPDWLLKALCPTENIGSLKKMLYVSCMSLKEKPWIDICQDSFTGGVVQYLAACRQYRQLDYVGALSSLREINFEKCGNSLQGWMAWLTGMSLFKIGKPNAALIKLQESIDKCISTVPAVFNVSQVFKKMGSSSGEVETLTLLVAIGHDWQPYQNMNLQSAILHLHHPPPDNLLPIAHFIHGARCLRLKMYEEAGKSIAALVQYLQDTPVVPLVNHRTLFHIEDNLPSLPNYESIVIFQALVSFQCGNYDMVITALNRIDIDGEYFNYYKDTSDKKMSCVCVAASRLIKSKALLKLDKTEESLRECIRLENDLSWVMGVSSTEWETCILVLKTLVYSFLGKLHNVKKNVKSHRHYNRLAVQNMNIIPQNMDLSVWDNLSMSDRLIMENIYCFLYDELKNL